MFNEIFAGSVGGLLQAFVGHPLDTIKTRLQSSSEFKNLSDAVSKTWKLEGVRRGFYKGFSVPLTTSVILNSSIFTLRQGGESVVRYALRMKRDQRLTVIQSIVAAEIIAPIYTLVVTPVDLVKIRLQSDSVVTQKRYTGPIHCLREVLKKEGFGALFSGYTATTTMRLIGLPFYFGGYQATVKYVCTVSTTICDSAPKPWHSLLGGAVAGITFWLAGFPADTIKTRMQNQKVSDVKALIGEIYRERGLRGFYKGFSAAALRSAPANAATFLGYDYVIKFLKRNEA